MQFDCQLNLLFSWPIPCPSLQDIRCSESWPRGNRLSRSRPVNRCRDSSYVVSPVSYVKSIPRIVPVLVANLSMGRPMRCSMLR